MRKKYNFDNGSYYACMYHVLWATHYKRPFLTEKMTDLIVSSVEARCQEVGMELVDLETNTNYVSAFISVPPSIDIHKAVKQIKMASSHALAEAYPDLLSKVPNIWDGKCLYLTASETEMSYKDIEDFLATRPTSQRKRGDA